MKVQDILNETFIDDCVDCEVEEVYVDQEGNVYRPEEFETLEEKAGGAITRQFKRYGDTFKRQYRCMSGPKKGRIVTKPADCGKRKDPNKVRQGKRSARMKKSQRVRKTLRTKMKPLSKILSRRNKVLRGDV